MASTLPETWHDGFQPIPEGFNSPCPACNVPRYVRTPSTDQWHCLNRDCPEYLYRAHK